MRLFLYHGTDEDSAKTIMSGQVQAAPLRPGLDFGSGFYTTKLARQAEVWANTRGRSLNLQPNIIRFETTSRDLSILESLAFTNAGRYSDDYWKFVRRMKSGRHHNHDGAGYFALVSGQCARRTSRFTMTRILDSDQFSFHGDTGLSFINSCSKSLITPSNGRRF